ncbi:uncharacterized protein LOC135342950 [Halichondria panicea]|uniref:uncharacterized protein LOC135342950 n=1 Tax=Halichondria panicea TaxID=6063 RepID=UPI00312B4840
MGEIATIRAKTTGLYKGRGRPPIHISLEQVELMREAKFTWKEISGALLISRSTLWRRLKQNGYSFRNYSDISDQELEDMLTNLIQQFPNTGLPIMSGHLLSLGIHIQRRRITDMLQYIDPVGRSQRWHSVVRRRTYSVPGPNSLWHIDGHHSLIRWRIVIHGGIDGYSRLIVFLHASTNNRAETVFNLFWRATQGFGVPSRVRSDKGGENVDVCYFMIMHRGEGRGSHIAGASVHNQHIERLWRDVYRCVCSLYHSLFHFMETTGILDPCNDQDMFVLQSVFLPRINLALHEFALAWNLHPVHNWSPKKMFLDGVLDESSASGIRDVVDDVPLDSLNYLFGVDYFNESNPTSTSECDRVLVTPTLSPLSPEITEEFLDSFDPLQECDDYGITVYTSAKETLATLIE